MVLHKKVLVANNTWVKTREVWRNELSPTEKIIAVISAGQLMHIAFNAIDVSRHFSEWFSLTKEQKNNKRAMFLSSRNRKEKYQPIIFFDSIDYDINQPSNVIHRPSLEKFLEAIDLAIKKK